MFIRLGKEGTPGRIVMKELDSAEEAAAFLAAERAERLADGYEVLDETAGIDAPFTRSGARPKPKPPALPAHLAHLGAQLRVMALGGFLDRDDAEQVIEDLALSERDAPPGLRGTLSALYDLEREAARARRPPGTRVNEAIDAAFEQLRKAGIVALQNAGYTQSDGWDDAREAAEYETQCGRPPVGACFYQFQDLERAVDGAGLLIAFGAFSEEGEDPEKVDARARQVASKVLETLRAHGVDASWSGDLKQRISIAPFEWYRQGA